MKLSKTKLESAIKGSFGNITVIAQKLQVERKTVYEWLEKDPVMKSLLTDERDKMLDLAENKLVAKINEGDSRLISFVLSTLGKSRGYTSGQEIKHSGTTEHIIREMTPEERKKRKLELLKKLQEPGSTD